MEHVAHPIDGGLVGRLLVAAAYERSRRESRRLGHADELEREVAVGRLLDAVGCRVRRGQAGTYISRAATTIVA
jgi:hypothetical protein